MCRAVGLWVVGGSELPTYWLLLRLLLCSRCPGAGWIRSWSLGWGDFWLGGLSWLGSWSCWAWLCRTAARESTRKPGEADRRAVGETPRCREASATRAERGEGSGATAARDRPASPRQAGPLGGRLRHLRQGPQGQDTLNGAGDNGYRVGVKPGFILMRQGFRLLCGGCVEDSGEVAFEHAAVRELFVAIVAVDGPSLLGGLLPAMGGGAHAAAARLRSFTRSSTRTSCRSARFRSGPRIPTPSIKSPWRRP